MIMVLMLNPPKLVYDDEGRLIEVIFSAEDYLASLRGVAAEEDWQSLPPHLQDAIDRMLIVEVRSAEEETIDLDRLLAMDKLFLQGQDSPNRFQQLNSDL
jgi:hypothetical protein